MRRSPEILWSTLIAALLSTNHGLYAHAQDTFDFPVGYSLTSDNTVSHSTFQLPIGPDEGKGTPTSPADGVIQTSTIKISGDAADTLSLRDFFSAQLQTRGYEIILDCDQQSCGGFDFLFSLPLVSAPAMEVGLTDYRYLAARKGQAPDQSSAALLISRTPAAAFVQLVTVSPTNGFAVEPQADEPVAVVSDSISEALTKSGHFALDGLEFASGKAELTADHNNVLGQVATWLLSNPSKTIVLVGHTDNDGSLESNIAVSIRRAEAVREALISDHKVPSSQLGVDGVGFLAPRASNDSPEGRTLNRRVEIIVR
jgi:outer membrane protein OmpA-like peptidoglycan-associated protein